VAGGETPSGRVDRDVEFDHLARGERFRVGQRPPPRRVQHPLGDEVRTPVERDVGEADRKAHHRGGRGDVQECPRPPDNRQRLVERRRCVDERERLVGALVAGEPELEAARPQPAADADRRVVLEGVGAVRARTFRQYAILRQVERPLLAAGWRPSGLGAPLPGRVEAVDDRRLGVLHVDDDRRIVHDPRVPAPAPVVKPAHDLAQVVDPRPEHGHVGNLSVPRGHKLVAGMSPRR